MHLNVCPAPKCKVIYEQLLRVRLPRGHPQTSTYEAIAERIRQNFEGRREAAARALDLSRIHVTSGRSCNDEDALQSAVSLAHCEGKLLFAGINYDEREKTHECKIGVLEKAECRKTERTDLRTDPRDGIRR